jgi:hypothetical protein
MNKAEALSKLNEFTGRLDFDFEEEEINRLRSKIDLMQESDFDGCKNAGMVYHTINCWIPKRKKAIHKPKNQAYYAVDIIDKITDKAYGFVTATNNMHGKNYSEYITWVAQSICVVTNGKTYIPAWVALKEGLWKSVNKNDKINIMH